MTLNESQDIVLSNNAPAKWRPAREVEETITAIKHMDIVGHVQHERGGLGLTTRCPELNNPPASEWRKMVVEGNTQTGGSSKVGQASLPW